MYVIFLNVDSGFFFFNYKHDKIIIVPKYMKDFEYVINCSQYSWNLWKSALKSLYEKITADRLHAAVTFVQAWTEWEKWYGPLKDWVSCNTNKKTFSWKTSLSIHTVHAVYWNPRFPFPNALNVTFSVRWMVPVVEKDLTSIPPKKPWMSPPSTLPKRENHKASLDAS